MNTKYRKLPARFGPETRFEVAPVAPSRGPLEIELDRFKDRLLQRLLNETEDSRLKPLLRRTATEASALAWTTAYPLLVLPVLLEEKAESARLYAERQARIWKQNPVFEEELV
ncbi:MAG: hypothetical protein ABI651_02755 [Verrucomicrobiota bacterium]